MKKFLISMMAFMLVLSIVLNVYAATGSITGSSSSDTVIKGKTFTVTLSATADVPIDGMYTKISYDKNVLSLESSSPEEGYANNSGEGEILLSSNLDVSPKSTRLITMNFKVLDSANVDTATISFSESELHLYEGDTTQKVNAAISDIVINIKADDTTAGNQEDTSKEETEKEDSTGTEEKEETPSNTTTDSSNKSTGSSSDKKNNTTKKTTTKLPQTGIENAGVIALVSLVIFSIVSFISYKNYKNI